MTPLLEAAVAARAVGLDVAKCWMCTDGHAVHVYLGDDVHLRPAEYLPCTNCHATGINPDPARLGWVALQWFDANSTTSMVTLGRNLPGKPTVLWSDSAPKSQESACLYENHDGTPAGLATALLRIVARVGGKT